MALQGEDTFDRLKLIPLGEKRHIENGVLCNLFSNGKFWSYNQVVVMLYDSYLV